MNEKNISTESIVNWIEDIVASDIDNEKVMMSVEKGNYYGLDPIGSRIWDLMEKPVKVADLIDTLLLKYDVERETCKQDVIVFLEELRKEGILQVEG